jgi:UDPglucose 6-dehydrogenase
MIFFLGSSYAAVTLREAARRRGLKIAETIEEARLIFVSEDTPTDATGKRDLDPIERLLHAAAWRVPTVLTSQVPPGFTRAHAQRTACDLYHQAETLRIEDGAQRAMYPEMFIVGLRHPKFVLHPTYQEYLEAFDCPIFKVNYEEAEFAKIAINAFLISQVETTNMLFAAASKVGADWAKVAAILRRDSRIGKFAYLTPGRWQDSKHLLRDFVTLIGIRKARLLDAWSEPKK